MTDDQFWRIVIGSMIFALIGAFRPQLAKLLRKIGYTGWK